MAEWWTYSLIDFLMFSEESLGALHHSINEAFWPAPLIATALGLYTVYAHQKGDSYRFAILGAATAFVVGYVYFYQHYSQIHWAGFYWAIAFKCQAAALLISYWRFPLPARANISSTSLWLYSYAYLVVLLFPALHLLPETSVVFGTSIFLFADPTALLLVLLLMLEGNIRRSWLGLIPAVWLTFSSLSYFALENAFWWLLSAPALLLLGCQLSLSVISPSARLGKTQ